MFELNSGLVLSIIISAIVAVFYALRYVDRMAAYFTSFDEVLQLSSLFLLALVSAFCIFFPIINLVANLFVQPSLLEPNNILNAFKTEFSNGVIALRIVSIVVGMTLYKSLFQAIRLEPRPLEVNLPKLFDFPETSELNISVDIPLFRNRLAHHFLNITQNGLYLLGIIVLWITNILNFGSLATSILAWMLLYIVDDWRIIFAYSLPLKGRILLFHRRQIWIFNILILFVGAICLLPLPIIYIVAYVIISTVVVRTLILLEKGKGGNNYSINAIEWKGFQRFQEERKLRRQK